MALNLTGRTKINISKEIGVQTGKVVTAEGMALVKAMENGEECVKPADGGDGASFAGVSYGHVFTPMTLSMVEEFIAPEGGGDIKIANEPLADQYMVYDETSGTKLTEVSDSASMADGTFMITDKTITLHSAQEGHVIKVQSRMPSSA